MKIIIEGLNSGSYYLMQDKLSFEYNKFEAQKTKYNDTKFEIDRKSALEITYTLLDSVNMLTKEAEELLSEVEMQINE